ncbi:ABC transporter permease [Brevibacillus daliensis]|uniref:ABC transporter permease n=1 Tax=Brevibacillus daliensis TaxID=2892995 RepID=UPI001E47F5F5|nr:ABC transporter permease [Brevibacillus daliensis]
MLKRFPYLFLLLPALILLLGVFVIPMLFILVLSFQGVEGQFSLENYKTIFTDVYYWEVLWKTIKISLYTVFFTLVLAFPVAMFMAKTPGKLRGLVTMLIICPHLISVVIRNFGWVVILGETGWINVTLMDLGLIEQPLRFMYNEVGVVIGLTDAFIAYMVLAIATSLYSIDQSLYKAASILGANRIQSFFHVTLPLSMPGVFAGITLVFSLSMSAYVTPALMGGTGVKVIPTLAFEQIMAVLNWPLGAALAILLLGCTVLLVTLFSRLVETKRYKEVFSS